MYFRQNMSQVNADFYLVASCLLEDPWIPTVLSMLENFPHQCPIILDLVRNVSVGWLLMVLPFHLGTQETCCTDKSSLPQSVRHWCMQLEGLKSRFTSNVGKNGQVGVLERVYQTIPVLSCN